MLVLTLMAVVVMSFAFNVNVLLPVLAKQTLGAGPLTFGIVTACFGAGALAGALDRGRRRAGPLAVDPRLGGRVRDRRAR